MAHSVTGSDAEAIMTNITESEYVNIYRALDGLSSAGLGDDIYRDEYKKHLETYKEEGLPKRFVAACKRRHANWFK